MINSNLVPKVTKVIISVTLSLCITVAAYAGEINWTYTNNTWNAYYNKVLLKDTWINYKGSTYHLDSNGNMSTDMIIDGYYVGLDGRYVPMGAYDVECNKIIQILKSDNPNATWVPVDSDGSRVISNLNNNRLFGNKRMIGTVYTDTKERKIANSVDEIKTAIEQFDYVNNYLNVVVNPILHLSDKDKIDAISNWITQRFEYSSSNLYSVYDAILLNETVCNGYAAIFKSMCNKVGIRCDVVTGKANNTIGIVLHAWNKVYLDGKEYYFDLCWNDMLSNNKYYFMSYEDIKVDHFEER